MRRRGENYAGDEESVDANVSNVTASTSKTWLLKTFPSHNLAITRRGPKVITASIADLTAKGLQPYSLVESDGFQDMVR